MRTIFPRQGNRGGGGRGRVGKQGSVFASGAKMFRVSTPPAAAFVPCLCADGWPPSDAAPQTSTLRERSFAARLRVCRQESKAAASHFFYLLVCMFWRVSRGNVIFFARGCKCGRNAIALCPCLGPHDAPTMPCGCALKISLSLATRGRASRFKNSRMRVGVMRLVRVFSAYAAMRFAYAMVRFACPMRLLRLSRLLM